MRKKRVVVNKLLLKLSRNAPEGRSAFLNTETPFWHFLLIRVSNEPFPAKINNQKCCRQVLKIHRNAFAAVTSPRTSLGAYSAPETSYLVFRGRQGKGRMVWYGMVY